MSTIAENLQKLVDDRDNIAEAIAGKGVEVPENSKLSEFPEMIESISGGGGTAVPSDVVAGKTFSSDAGTELVGTMASYTDEEIVFEDISELDIESKDTFDRFMSLSNTAYYSFDGIAWTAIARPSISFSMYGVGYGDGKYVITGNYNNQLGSIYTTDCVNWVLNGVNLGGSYARGPIVYGNKMFVTLARATYYGYYSYSMDGITWTNGSMTSYYGSSYAYGEDIVYGKDKFIAAMGASNQNGGILYSFNGSTWNKTNIKYVPDALVYGNDIYLGFYTNIMYKSTDGVTWETKSFPDYSCRGAAYGNGRFVTVGIAGKSYYSFDGENWTAMSGLSGTNYRKVSYANGTFICVGNTGHRAYSTDGETWIDESIGTSDGQDSVAGIDSVYYYSYPIPEGYHASQKILIKKG